MANYGFINLDKPLGMTSHDCVGKLRRILQTKKIGHGGTLDPLARGVLPIAVGRATRLLQFLPKAKQYIATIRFGVTTTTDDLAGDILTEGTVEHLTLAQLEALLPQFLGVIAQRPPMYSAIKKEGKKLYDLARQGKTIDVPPRPVTITAIEVLGWRGPEDRAEQEPLCSELLPELTLKIDCGEGTYIRSLARDLGVKVGCGATLAALQRTLSCGLSLGASLTFEEIERLQGAGALELTAPLALLNHLPTVILQDSQVQPWYLGQKISGLPHLALEQWMVVQDPQGQLLGMAIVQEREGQIVLAPKVVFPPGS